MKLTVPHGYATHLDILVERIRQRHARERAEAANARQPARRVVPMTTEARMSGYLLQGGRMTARPTPRQRKRLMRKAGILDPDVVDAAWTDTRGDVESRIHVIWDECRSWGHDEGWQPPPLYDHPGVQTWLARQPVAW
jgi:hypothetical protein